jgi:hypothetical protein
MHRVGARRKRLAWSLRNGSTDVSLPTGDHKINLTVDKTFTARRLLIALMILLVSFDVSKEAQSRYFDSSGFRVAATVC